MKKLLFLIISSLTYCATIAAQTNQNADPALVAVFQNPNTIPNVGDMAQMCVRVTNAGTDPIPANTVRVTMSWGSFVEYVSDNNVASQGWTITQTFPNSVTLENTTDMIDVANLDVKDLCVNISSVALGISSAGANISRKFGVSSMVGNASVMNDNVQAGYQVLPVELTAFTAKSKDCKVELAWQTASEIDNSHFEIEHSTDGKSFEAIAKVAGAGTTVEVQNYSYTQAEAPEGVLYYRLRAIDDYGGAEYSKVVSVDNQCKEYDKSMDVFPNPIGNSERLQVQFYNEEVNVELSILDINNQVVRYYEFDVEVDTWLALDLDLGHLPAGVYYLRNHRSGKVVRFVRAE